MKPATTTTIIKAMRILQTDIQSDDGVANAAIGEAAERLEQMRDLLISALVFIPEHLPMRQKVIEATR